MQTSLRQLKIVFDERDSFVIVLFSAEREGGREAESHAQLLIFCNSQFPIKSLSTRPYNFSSSFIPPMIPPTCLISLESCSHSPYDWSNLPP